MKSVSPVAQAVPASQVVPPAEEVPVDSAVPPEQGEVAAGGVDVAETPLPETVPVPWIELYIGEFIYSFTWNAGVRNDFQYKHDLIYMHGVNVLLF